MEGLLLGDLGVREQYWKPGERRRSIPFPLDLKAQHGFWDQKVRDTSCWRSCGWEGSERWEVARRSEE